MSVKTKKVMITSNRNDLVDKPKIKRMTLVKKDIHTKAKTTKQRPKNGVKLNF